MPSVYETRHIELDGVGRSKRTVRPPGGEDSDIFGTRSPSANGSIASSPSTPGSSNPNSRRGSLRGEDTKNRLFGENQESPRRIRDNLKSTIFNDDIDHSPKPSPKKTVARRNPITGEIVVSTTNGLNSHSNGNGHLNGNALLGLGNGLVSNGNGLNGHNSNGNGLGSNGHSGHGSVASIGSVSPVSMPGTPSRARQPPGGKCAGIF